MLTQESALRKDTQQPRGRQVFQHRHYAEVARIIREGFTEGGRYGARHLAALIFADELGRENHNFNRARFLRACGE